MCNSGDKMIGYRGRICLSLCSGVPQGSILSPILFTLHTFPLGSDFHKRNILYQLYADETLLDCLIAL